MKTKNIYLIISLLVLSSISIAQVAGDEKTKGIKELLEKYQMYGQFTIDGNSTNTEYAQNFVALFETTSKMEVYNDMAAKKGEPFSFGSAQEYMQYVIRNYPYGIDISLDFSQMKVIDKFKLKGKEGYIVQIPKRITGLYLIKSFHRFNGTVYFFINETVTDKGAQYKIARVLDPVTYQKYDGNQRITGLYAGFSGGYGQTMIMNNSVLSATEIYTDLEYQYNKALLFEVNYMFTRGFGLGTGIGFSTYSSAFMVNQFTSNSTDITLTDEDGDTYFPLLEVNNLVETDVINSVDIPVMLKFRTGKGKTAFYIDMGVIYSMITAEYSLQGTQTKSGYYPEYEVLLDDVEEYGFGTFSFNNEAQELKLKETANLSAYLGMGLSIPLTGGLYMKLGVNARYGITDIGLGQNLQPFDFSNFIKNPGSTNLIYGGAEIGLSYNFSKLFNKPKNQQPKAEVKVDDI